MRNRATTRWSVALLLAGLLAGSLTGVANAESPPGGHEQLLVQLIADAGRGEINYQTMTPALASAVRSQAATSLAELTALGALKSIKFVRVDDAGAERYRTIFERGALEWAFSVDGHGLIVNARFRPLSAAL